MVGGKLNTGYSWFLKIDWNKWERVTIEKMIVLYCCNNHDNRTLKSRTLKKNLCGECSALLEYSLLRIEKCQFGIKKSNCSDCAVHCFKPEMRESVKKTMRYSGPRMIIYYPFTALVYLYRTKRHQIQKF